MGSLSTIHRFILQHLNAQPTTQANFSIALKSCGPVWISPGNGPTLRAGPKLRASDVIRRRPMPTVSAFPALQGFGDPNGGYPSSLDSIRNFCVWPCRQFSTSYIPREAHDRLQILYSSLDSLSSLQRVSHRRWHPPSLDTSTRTFLSALFLPSSRSSVPACTTQLLSLCRMRKGVHFFVKTLAMGY